MGKGGLEMNGERKFRNIMDGRNEFGEMAFRDDMLYPPIIFI
jgi:hypothetical protein